MFAANHAAASSIIIKRQRMRAPKTGGLVVKGVLVNYIAKAPGASAQSRGVASQTPPPVAERSKRDEPSAKYNAKIPITFRITECAPDGVACTPAVGGGSGWRIKGVYSYFDDSKNFLLQSYAQAWTPDPNSTEPGALLYHDAMSERIRQLIDATGKLLEYKWYDVVPGETVDAKVPDADGTKENIFREKNPQNQAAHKLQPPTPLVLVGVELKVYVTFKMIDVEDGTEAGTAYDAPTLSAAEEAAAAVQAAAAPAVVAVATTKKKKPSHKEPYLYISPKYEANVAYVDATFDSSVAPSEQKHESMSKDTHQLVPIDDVRSRKRAAPASFYYYVAMPFYKSADGCPTGVAVLRNLAADPEERRRAFYGEFNSVKKPTCNISFTVYQWSGEPNEREYYVLNARDTKNGTEFWRNYGITSMEPYIFIGAANPELPLHVCARIYWDDTMKHPSNGVGELGPTEANLKSGVGHLYGFYQGLLDELWPDFLRFFRSGAALRLSPKRVQREFERWVAWRGNPGAQTAACVLQATDQLSATTNPVNAANGIKSAVIALGNGKVENPGNVNDIKGLNVAFAGEDIMQLFNGPAGNDSHDFFVLTSKMMTPDERKEERAAWCSVLDRTKYADDYLDTLIKDHKVLYWIYAVARNAKMAGQTKREIPIAVKADVKRTADDMEPDTVRDDRAGEAAAVEPTEPASKVAAVDDEEVDDDGEAAHGSQVE